MYSAKRQLAGMVRNLVRPVLDGFAPGAEVAAITSPSSAQITSVSGTLPAGLTRWLSYRQSSVLTQQSRPFVQVQRELDEQQQKKQQQQEQEFTSQHHQRAGECSQLSQKSYFLEQQQQQPTTASQNPSSGQLESPTRRADPFSLVRDEIEAVSERLRRSILTDIPSLEKAAEYFFRAGAEGKRLRSTVLLLLATSLSASPLQPVHLTVDDSPPAVHPQDQRRRQQRLAEITELIHVASLLHDDVIDNADTRRGLRALNTMFGNKVAILAGDFLLARASVSLASLKNNEVVMLMSQVLENLVAGEILQMMASPEDAASMEYYLRKTYCKTASLVANSCRSISELAGLAPEVSQLCWEYGRHLGLAFQVVDDVMDFTSTAQEMGKPSLNDLRSGLATAPVLYAAEEHPQLVPLIQRRFRQEGDVELAQQLVEQSSGIQRARELALHHAEQAAKCIDQLPPVSSTEALYSRHALIDLTKKVLHRKS